jgi:hypothetical protein
MATGRVLDAGLHLLDRQVIDSAEHLVCNVDDLELTESPDGALYVSAILAGPGALATRLGGWLGRLLRSRRTFRIDFGVVNEVGTAIRIALRREEHEVNAGEAWVRDHVVAKIPGARHASE